MTSEPRSQTQRLRDSETARTLETRGSTLVSKLSGRSEPTLLPPVLARPPSSAFCRGVSGFTLVELLVTVTVLAILAMIAVPSMQEFVRKNRVIAQINALLADLTFARSEAIKRATTIRVCNSKDQASCTADTKWTEGWIVIVAGTVLRKTAALEGGNTLTNTAGLDSAIDFLRDGAPTTAGELTLCDAGKKYGRALTLESAGQMYISDKNCT
jgi:type IV fimbrial biogenesis protein FimT